MGFLTSIKEHWTKYVSETSIHGIPDIQNASTVKKRIFWSVLLIVALAATVWEIMMVFNEYKSSPIITTYQLISQRTQEFPKIEICLDNMVNREKVLALKLAPVLVNYALLTLPANLWVERSAVTKWAAASGIIRAEPMLFPIAIQKNRTYALNKSRMLSDRFNITYEERVIGFAQVEAEISDALSIKNTQAHFILDTWKQIEDIIRILQENNIEINKPVTTVKVLEIPTKKPTTVKMNMGTTTTINRGYFEYLDEKNIMSVYQKLKKSAKIYQKPLKFKVTTVDGTDIVTATQETDHPTMQTTDHPTTTLSDEQVIELILAAAENQYTKDQLLLYLGYTAEETPTQDEIFEKVQQQPYLLVMLGLFPDDSKEQMIERLHAEAPSSEKTRVTRIQESITNTQKPKVGSDTTKPTDSQIGTTILTDGTSDQPTTNTTSSTTTTNHPTGNTTQATNHSMMQTTGHSTTTMSDEQVIELILAAAENQYTKDQLLLYLGYTAEETPPQDEIFEKVQQQPYLLVILGLSPDDSKEQIIERLHVKARSPEKKQVTRIQESFTNTRKPKVGSDATKPTDSQIGTTIKTDGTSDQPTTNTTSSNETTNHLSSITTQATAKVGSDTIKPTDSQIGTTISTDGTSDQPKTNITSSTETTDHPTSTTTQATAKVGSDTIKPTDSQIGTTISTHGTSDQPKTNITSSTETTYHPTSTTTQATAKVGSDTIKPTDSQIGTTISTDGKSDQPTTNTTSSTETTNHPTSTTTQATAKVGNDTIKPTDSQIGTTISIDGSSDQPTTNTTSSTETTNHPTSTTTQATAKVGSDTIKPTDSQIGTTISIDGTSDQPTTNTTFSTETTNHPSSTTTQATAKVESDTIKPTDSQIGTTISTDGTSDQYKTNITSSTETTDHPTSTTTQATDYSITQTTGQQPTTTMSDAQVIELLLAATENQYSKDQLLQFLGYTAEETPPQDEIFEKLQQQPYLLVMLGLSPDDSKEQMIERLHAKAQSPEKKRVKRNIYQIASILEKAGINIWTNVYLAELAKELYFGGPPEVTIRKILKKMLTNYENHTPHIDVFTRHYDNIEKYIIDQETGDLDVEKLFHSVGHTASELIELCYFQITKSECAQFTKTVFDHEFGHCFLIEMEEGQDQLVGGSGLKIILDTMSSTSWQDIPPLTDGISVRISNEFNPVTLKSFQIPAGTAAKINFQATHYMLNQSEKHGRCKRNMPRKFTTAPYSDSVCRLECALMKLVEKCGCLFGVSKRFIKSGLTYPFCAEVGKLDCLTRIDLQHKDDKFDKCLNECRPPCDYYDYSPVVSYKNFPSRQLYEWTKIINKQWSSHKERYFHSRIFLDIAYSSMEHMQVEEKDAMSVHGFISQIGGHLGLFLGASALSFAQILFYCVFWSYDWKQKVSNDDGDPKKSIVYETGQDPDIVPKPASLA